MPVGPAPTGTTCTDLVGVRVDLGDRCVQGVGDPHRAERHHDPGRPGPDRDRRRARRSPGRSATGRVPGVRDPHRARSRPPRPTARTPTGIGTRGPGVPVDARHRVVRRVGHPHAAEPGGHGGRPLPDRRRRADPGSSPGPITPTAFSPTTTLGLGAGSAVPGGHRERQRPAAPATPTSSRRRCRRVYSGTGDRRCVGTPSPLTASGTSRYTRHGSPTPLSSRASPPVEAPVRPGHQVPDAARDQNLARSGQRGDPGPDVHRHPADLAAAGPRTRPCAPRPGPAGPPRRPPR